MRVHSRSADVFWCTEYVEERNNESVTPHTHTHAHKFNRLDIFEYERNFKYVSSNNAFQNIMIIFTNPSARAGYDTRSIFKRSLTGLNSEFSFSYTNCPIKAEEPSLSYYLAINIMIYH